MGRRTVAIIIAALLALFAAGLIWWYIGSVRAEGTADGPTINVLYATSDIPVGTSGNELVKTRAVEIKAVPVAYKPAASLTSEVDLKDKVVVTAVAKGQALTTSAVASSDNELLIETGYRAVAIPLERVRGVAGQVKPGSQVDIIASFKSGQLSSSNFTFANIFSAQEQQAIKSGANGYALENEKGDITKTLLQRVKVLRVDGATVGSGGPSAGGGASDKPAVVLMLKPGDVEKLVFAQENGLIWMSLVPGDVTQDVKTTGRAIINEYLQ